MTSTSNTRYDVPAEFSIADEDNSTDILFDIAAKTPDRTMFRDKRNESWEPIRADTVAAQVTDLAKGLIASGVSAGDRVALLSRTRLEWVLMDFAIWSAGAITVPIYDSSSASQIEWILSDSAATSIVIEDDAHRAVFDEVTGLPEPLHVFQIEGEGGTLADVVDAGTGVSDDDVTARRKSLRSVDPAILIYTSGTTGRPKGCQLTHANLLAEIQGVLESSMRDLLGPDKRLLMFLPLAHVLAHAITLVAIEAGVEVGFSNDIPHLVDEFGEFRPSLILSVPRVFEKVFNAAQQQAKDGGKEKIFDMAVDTAVEWSQASAKGSVGLVLKAKHAVFDRLVYARLRSALGGRCELAISGGAPLGARLSHFFNGVGIPIYEGYGLTETTAAFSVNTPGAVKVGTVGRPLAGNSVRVADDGEVLLSGQVVFHGYWNNDEATAAALEDGWFHTGDLGGIDEDGFITITGRKKELIVTAGGKNVSPSGLEDIIRANPVVSQAMVVGDQKPFIAVLVTIDDDAFGAWKANHGKSEDATVADLVDDEDLRASIQRSIDEANKTVSHAESIKKFRILPVDFSEAGGEVTPTLKVKRNVVADKYSNQIDAIYSKR